MEEINRRIGALRMIKKMSQSEFSQQCNMKIERLRSIESGKGIVKSSEVGSISTAFNVTSDFLLGTDDYPHPIPTSFEKSVFWFIINRMQPKEIEQVIQILQSKI